MGDARTRRRFRGKIEETDRNSCHAINSDALLTVFSESKKCRLFLVGAGGFEGWLLGFTSYDPATELLDQILAPEKVRTCFPPSNRFDSSFRSGCAVRFSSFFCFCGWIGGWEPLVAGAISVSDTAQGRVESTTNGYSPGFSTVGVLLKEPSSFSFVGGWMAGICGLVLSQILTTKHVLGSSRYKRSSGKRSIHKQGKFAGPF